MNKQNTKQEIWSRFTRLYSLNKTLRFELKPVGKTADFLKQNKVFERDKTIDDSYNQAKFYFDKLHQKFINEALKKKNVRGLDLKDFADKFLQLKNEIQILKQKGERNKIYQTEKEIADLRSKYYRQIKSFLDKRASDWIESYRRKGVKLHKTDLKQNGTDFLTKAGILGILKYEFPKEKETKFVKQCWPSLFVDDKVDLGNKVYIFDSFNNFTTYLAKFQETRKNLYKDDGTNTAVATRIISNFERFLSNKKIFDEKYKNLKGIGLAKGQMKIFKHDYYYNCFIQEGIDKYNKILGEINKISKEYRDKNKLDKSQLPLFKTLDKQILGEMVKKKEIITKTENETEAQSFVKIFKELITKNKAKIPKAKLLIDDLTNGKFENDYEKIYLKRQAINIIANKWFRNPTEFLSKLPQSSKSRKDGESLKIKSFISFLDIKNGLEELDDERDYLGRIFKDKYYRDENNNEVLLNENVRESYYSQFLKVLKYEFESLFKDKFEIKTDKKEKQIFWGYTRELESKAEKLSSFTREKISLVKNYCDASLRIYQMMRYFSLETKSEKDIPVDCSTEFYNRFDEYYKDFNFIRYYNAIRNFVTKKPFDDDKIKLNFESGNLLTGFDKNKESEKLGIFLRRDNKYFLGIINKEHNKIFDEKKYPELKGKATDRYEKMELRLFPNPKRMIPKIVFADKNVKEFGLSENIKRIKEDMRVRKENKFSKDKLIKLIKYYQDCLKKGGYKKEFNFTWKNADEYQSLSEFYSDIEKNNYKIKFIKISDRYIDERVAKGDLYLFEISNKDFVWPNKKKNIHTLYFLNLFSDENLNNPIFRIGANAEIFYRPASLKPKKEIRGRHKKKIIKYKRYTEDKILFHLPIVINATKGSLKQRQFNKRLNQFIAKNKDRINIIGIDRGEKNLLYYTVINQQGEILEHSSLNEINGVNYFNKLVEKEKERQLNRQSWEPIVKIKDLKKGYISYVVRKIADLVEKYNAIVVLEDLNMRFKQIRGGIERTIYQQFEKQLIDKLGYLVFKDNRNSQSPGGILTGYQLTAPFTTFRDLGKQTGIIFYTTAEYTSKTDPLTGFRKNIYISNSVSNKEVIKLIEKMKIGWDKKEKSYYFIYNQKDFNSLIDKEWIIYSKVPRVRREYNKKSGKWDYKLIKPENLNQLFKELFEKWNFKNIKSNNLKFEILQRKEELAKNRHIIDDKEVNFFQRFIYLFNLLLQIRNTISLNFEFDSYSRRLKQIDYGVDFIASPVKPFFTTAGIIYLGKESNENKIEKDQKKILVGKNFADFEKLFKNCSSDGFDSDGVGAYNIARKGIMVLERIKENPDRPDLYISKEDWDKFVINNSLVK